MRVEFKEIISLSDLPNPDDQDEVIQFAGSFNGYEYHGSFAACAETAKASKRDTLEDLRTELFFYYRASNHQGSHVGICNFYKELKPLFVKHLSAS